MDRPSGAAVASMAADWRAWARELAGAHPEIAMVVLFDAGERADDRHVALVMRDGRQASWFAAGKGVEGLAWETVPGRQTRARILADPRLRRPGLHVYLNFCDARALMLVDRDGEERIGGEAVVSAPYRVLHPEPDAVPGLEEFFLLWGAPLEGPARPEA